MNEPLPQTLRAKTSPDSQTQTAANNSEGNRIVVAGKNEKTKRAMRGCCRCRCLLPLPPPLPLPLPPAACCCLLLLLWLLAIVCVCVCVFVCASEEHGRGRAGAHVKVEDRDLILVRRWVNCLDRLACSAQRS